MWAERKRMCFGSRTQKQNTKKPKARQEGLGEANRNAVREFEHPGA